MGWQGEHGKVNQEVAKKKCVKLWVEEDPHSAPQSNNY